MEEQQPGAETQVTSDKQTAAEAIWDGGMAEPNGGEEKPEPSVEKSEEKSEEKTEEKSEEKKEDGKGEADKKEEKKEEPDKRETFKKALSQEKSQPLPEKRPRHPRIKEGDYSISDDGKVTIHAKHIVDDYNAILDKTSVFFKIFDSNNNRDKAEFIAEHLLGFKSDGVRTAGRIAYDVLDAFNNAEGKEARAEIVEKFFPALLKDTEAELDVVFDETPPEKEKDEELEDEIMTEEDLSRAVKIWKADSGSGIDVETVLDDPDFYEAFNSFKFDIETGEPLSLDEKVAFAAESVFTEERTLEDGGRDIQVGNIKGDSTGNKPKDKDADLEARASYETTNIDAGASAW